MRARARQKLSDRINSTRCFSRKLWRRKNFHLLHVDQRSAIMILNISLEWRCTSPGSCDLAATTVTKHLKTPEWIGWNQVSNARCTQEEKQPLHMFRMRRNKITNNQNQNFDAEVESEREKETGKARRSPAHIFLICIVCLIIVPKMCRTFYYRTSTGVLSIVVQTHFCCCVLRLAENFSWFFVLFPVLSHRAMLEAIFSLVRGRPIIGYLSIAS